MNPLLTVKELSGIFNLKLATIYALAARDEIPYYRIGKSIRFNIEEIKVWLEQKKVKPQKRKEQINDILDKVQNLASLNIDLIVKNAIEESKQKEYNSFNGKPDKFKPLRKGGTHGGI